MGERRPKCGTCRFWNAGQTGIVGECRRHAPSPRVLFGYEPVSVEAANSELTIRWPEVRAEDWCGEHQPLKPVTPFKTAKPTAADRREDAARSSPAISGLSTRSKKVMSLLGVTTWEQLSKLTTEHVRGQKGTGVGTINELRDALKENGLSFRDERGG